MQTPCPVTEISFRMSYFAMSASHAHLSISEQVFLPNSFESESPEAIVIIGDLIGDLDVQVGRVTCKRSFVLRCCTIEWVLRGAVKEQGAGTSEMTCLPS